MKEVTVYYADDGTKFDTEDECYEYELAQEYLLDCPNDHLRVFDGDKNPVTVGSVVDETWQDEGWFFIIYDDIGLEYLKAAEKYTGVSLPTDIYDGDDFPLVYAFTAVYDYVNLIKEYGWIDKWL